MNQIGTPMRFVRNQAALSPAEQEGLSKAAVLVLGCGGLGGYIIEELARIGVGRITVWDGDCYEESNLNRQLLALTTNLGTPKAEAAIERVRVINPAVKTRAVTSFFTGTPEDMDIIAGHQLVIDALDTTNSRLELNRCCKEAGITLVHGAVSGWWGQLAVIEPGDTTLEVVYQQATTRRGSEQELGCPVMTVAVIASLQVTEAIKVLLGRPHLQRGQLLVVDLLNLDMQIMAISPLLDTPEVGQ